MIDVLISLTGGNLFIMYTCLNHHTVHFQYLTILSANDTLIRLKKNGTQSSMCSSLYLSSIEQSSSWAGFQLTV